MKLTCSLAASVMLGVMLACSGSSPMPTQPAPTNSPCAFGISPSTASFAAGGGSQIVSVTALPAGCSPSSWAASSVNGSLFVAPASGSGTGNVTVTVSPNAASTSQSLSATIAGQTFTANVGAACAYTFSANAPDLNGNTWVVQSDGSERGVVVTVMPNDGSCAPWRVTSNVDWITVSPTSGTTSTIVRVDYSANNTTASRTGSVSFTRPGCSGSNCGVTVGVNQAAQPTLFTLHLTLALGEVLGGPFAGVVTGPNRFSCSNAHSSTQLTPCPPVAFAAGSAVTLTVTLTLGLPGDQPIFWSTGCDPPYSSSTCTVNMNSDRDVTIAIGCAVCLSDVASSLQVETVGLMARSSGDRATAFKAETQSQFQRNRLDEHVRIWNRASRSLSNCITGCHLDGFGWLTPDLMSSCAECLIVSQGLGVCSPAALRLRPYPWEELRATA